MMAQTVHTAQLSGQGQAPRGVKPGSSRCPHLDLVDVVDGLVELHSGLWLQAQHARRHQRTGKALRRHPKQSTLAQRSTLLCQH